VDHLRDLQRKQAGIAREVEDGIDCIPSVIHAQRRMFTGRRQLRNASHKALHEIRNRLFVQFTVTHDVGEEHAFHFLMHGGAFTSIDLVTSNYLPFFVLNRGHREQNWLLLKLLPPKPDERLRPAGASSGHSVAKCHRLNVQP
jgi:hypothetical protein